MHLELGVLGQAKGRRYSLSWLSMIVALIFALVRDEELVGSHNEKSGTRRPFSSCIALECSRAIHARSLFLFVVVFG
jgi:hypothetical protein